ncbi:hypothetical protein B7P43_G04734 [Cryptotermes secundus]|uniref:BESS domain-containing protein n=1 Tax=Cryptotermes secundus TaxID=105785 RepID=A0A2J7PKM4_9NEOP|nr:hypothetical protein B7P43_G04734 [Cryptotermes secundus]
MFVRSVYLFSVAACKEVWKHIRTVFIRRLHDKTPSGSSATKKHPYYLHDAMQFMIPYITKNRHQESKTPDPDAEFLHSLLPDMKSMTVKQKCTFKTGTLYLMDELLEGTDSD